MKRVLLIVTNNDTLSSSSILSPSSSSSFVVRHFDRHTTRQLAKSVSQTSQKETLRGIRDFLRPFLSFSSSNAPSLHPFWSTLSRRHKSALSKREANEIVRKKTGRRGKGAIHTHTIWVTNWVLFFFFLFILPLTCDYSSFLATVATAVAVAIDAFIVGFRWIKNFKKWLKHIATLMNARSYRIDPSSYRCPTSFR